MKVFNHERTHHILSSVCFGKWLVYAGLLGVCLVFLLSGCDTGNDGEDPCQYNELSRLDISAGFSGDQITLYGSWSETRDRADALIYAPIRPQGGWANLVQCPIVSWSTSKVVIEIPEKRPGFYKIQMACNNSWSAPYPYDDATRVKEFAVLPPGEEPCGIRLYGISRTSAKPGDRITLYGSFGSGQGTKTPSLNDIVYGDRYKMPVLYWSRSRVMVQVPELAYLGGLYNLGMYCKDTDSGPSYCTEFYEIEIIPVPLETLGR